LMVRLAKGVPVAVLGTERSRTEEVRREIWHGVEAWIEVAGRRMCVRVWAVMLTEVEVVVRVGRD
jgi:hypothetical protein